MSNPHEIAPLTPNDQAGAPEESGPHEIAAAPDRGAAGESLLEIADLDIFATSAAGLNPIVRRLSLSIASGETVGLVGESGSGKSLTARIAMHLPPNGIIASGSVRYRGEELMTATEDRMCQIRGRQVSMLFQDPFTMLSPLTRAGAHIEEGLAPGRGGAGGRPARAARRAEALQRLAEVGITDPAVADRFPFQLSGGMRQRVALAAALARDPDLLIADEPTTALDVTTQAEILKLLRRLRDSRRMGLLLITHDLSVAFMVCDRIYVLYAGSVVEVAPAAGLRAEPLHPYSLGLVLSEPPVDRRVAELHTIEGSVPRLDQVRDSCAYAARCRWATDSCAAAVPQLRDFGPGRQTACDRIERIRPELVAERRLAGRAAPAVPAPASDDAVVSVESLRKTFRIRGIAVEALRGVSLEVRPGESVGLVGESGSGKTTLGRCIVGLESADGGRLRIGGVDALERGGMRAAQRRTLRRTVQMIFQDPYSSLDPSQTVASALAEIQTLYGGKGAVDPMRLLAQVGLSEAHGARRPAALSGGERQRVAIARALAVNPKMLICDEPVSALDVSVQGQVLRLFRSLHAELGISYLFITHDFAVVRQLVERVYVMYRGEIVEQGTVERVLTAPEHPYTRQLVASIPGRSIPAGASG
ncbi:MAG: ABC transporter ATP-binding protein [Actinomycetia bacterium]|nr:ABC transporter ATP-binding protein [Actinomycetes bacterium]